MKNPDERYKELTNCTNIKYDEIIEFINNEANDCIELKDIFDQCDSDEYFEENIDLMVKLSNNIRTISLNSLQSSYNLFQFKQRSYITKFRQIIKR